MDFYYELFFDGDEINDFWGTSEVVLDHDTYELCAQQYYVHTTDDELEALDDYYTAGEGVGDNEMMMALLESRHAPITMVADDDLVNCVYPDTVSCLYAFREIDKDEYLSEVGE